VTPWVRRLIVANIGVLVLQSLVPDVTPALILVPAAVLVRPWTIVTYMFLHSGILHILFNMLALYWFGPRVEQRLGSRQFLLLYFASGIGGGLLSFVTPHVPILGASGAIMGVMMAYAIYWPHERFLIYGVIPIEAWLLVLLYVGMDVVGAGGFGGAGIAHYAHLGGAAVGFLYLKFLEHRSPARAWQTQTAGSATPSALGDRDNMRRWREIRLDALHSVNRDEIVRLLEKAQSQGTHTLTPIERATLDRFAGRSSAH
jgi:membrane associated rhomboid family serine protease